MSSLVYLHSGYRLLNRLDLVFNEPMCHVDNGEMTLQFQNRIGLPVVGTRRMLTEYRCHIEEIFGFHFLRREFSSH